MSKKSQNDELEVKCNVCRIILSSKNSLMQHFKSQSHRKLEFDKNMRGNLSIYKTFLIQIKYIYIYAYISLKNNQQLKFKIIKNMNQIVHKNF